MGKAYVDDEMGIQTLREQGLGCQTISSLCEKWGRTLCILNTTSNKLFLQGFELLASCDSVKCKILMFLFDFNIMMKIAIFIIVVLHGSAVV